MLHSWNLFDIKKIDSADWLWQIAGICSECGVLSEVVIYTKGAFIHAMDRKCHKEYIGNLVYYYSFRFKNGKRNYDIVPMTCGEVKMKELLS